MRAWEGAAPSAGGWDAIRPSVRRASILRRKGEGVVDVVVRAVDVDFGKWRVQVRSAPKLPVLQFGAEFELITGVIADQVLQTSHNDLDV